MPAIAWAFFDERRNRDRRRWIKEMKKRNVYMVIAAGAAVGFVGTWAVRRRFNHDYEGARGTKVQRSVVINRPAAELYLHWRNLEMLSDLSRHLEHVEAIDASRSRWEFSIPGGVRLKWEAEVVADRENELIGWRSVAGSHVDIAGSVRFQPQAVGLGTCVTVSLQYAPPGGRVGAALASMLGGDPETLIDDALHRFKTRMEAGSGPQPVKQTPGAGEKRGAPLQGVDDTSSDSFPASDPPSWTGTSL